MSSTMINNLKSKVSEEPKKSKVSRDSDHDLHLEVGKNRISNFGKASYF